MTRFLLIRHAAHAWGGHVIAGRTDAPLSDLGQAQAARLAERLGALPIRALYSSPVLRARETAAPLAARLGLKVELCAGLSEIDFGDWTGKPLDDLRPLERFRQWNQFRSGTRIPGGEVALQTQARIVLDMLRLRAQHPDACLALFSHGDVIKAALAYFLGVPVDLYKRIEISLASVSIVALGDYGPWVFSVNHTGEVELP